MKKTGIKKITAVITFGLIVVMAAPWNYSGAVS